MARTTYFYGITKTIQVMIRTIILFSFLITAFIQKSNSQVSFSANGEYGQIYDIVFDAAEEGTLYARTVGNHIIKTADDGATWDVLYSDPMERYCTLSNLRLINNGENLSFIVKAEGTDYSKVVIIDKEDGAVVKEYNVPNPQETDVLIASYDIYDGDNDIAVLHTTYTVNFGFTNEVFITTDGGSSWESIYLSLDYMDVSINNVAIYPDNPNKLFLMRGVSPGSEMGGLFMSGDAGATWEEKIPGNTYSAIAFNPGNANDILLGTFYGYGSHQENLYRSADGGETWNIVPITYTSMSNDNINHIEFNSQNTDNIIVLEENEIIRSNDNGLTWQNEVYTEVEPEEYYYGLTASFNPFVTDDVVISANFYPFRSSDGGITLEKFESSFVNSTGRIDSYFNGTENHLYYGLRNGFIHRDESTGVENGYRLRSLNNTFGATTFPYADKEVSGRIFNSSRFGMNSVVEMSLDHGENYVSLYSTMDFLNIYTLATAPSNTDLVWFSFGEMAYKMDVSDPLAPIVEPVTLPSFDLFYGIVIDPADAEQVTITQGVKVYKTNDGGATWEESSSGLEALVQGQDMILQASINPLDANEYLLATTQGVFLSTDQGENWTQIFDEYVDKVSFSNVSSGHIVAINHYSDGSLFPESSSRIVYSTDNGLNWEIISGEALEYLNSSSSTIQFFEESADVYFGTFDAGLAKYTVDLSTLGMENNQLDSQEIALFPNPTTDKIKVIGKNSILKSVTIYSLSGQMVLKAVDTTQYLDVSKLSSGVHLVKVETESGIFFKRLIKR